MKNIESLIKDTAIEERRGPASAEVTAIVFDSRAVAPGSLFVALPGTRVDGHDYIDAAVAAGAVAVLCERMPEALDPAVLYLRVADAHRELGRVAAGFYDHPDRRLKLVGVTGTNGKTTTASLLHELFGKLGHPSGLISTVVYKVGGREIPSTHTTPDAVRIYALLAEMAAAGCEYCFMEVSSHSVVQRRIEGLSFAGAIFTNLTHDHLDYHGTFAEYLKAKKTFFDGLPSGAFALVNADDKNGAVMVQNTRATVKTYALKRFSDFRCKILESHVEGMLIEINGREVWVKFAGKFNAYNLLAVYGSAVLLGVERDEALRVLSELVPVSGRFELLRSAGGVTAVVDYAHTPDALANVLASINEIRRAGQRLYTVVGCGGDRDRAKRPVMARIAAEGSTRVILTSDNPRSERPEAILAEMQAGLPAGAAALTIADRREAIKTAVALAVPGDIILVAGKGHETYQIIGESRSHFDDREELRKAFEL